MLILPWIHESEIKNTPATFYCPSEFPITFRGPTEFAIMGFYCCHTAPVLQIHKHCNFISVPVATHSARIMTRIHV